MLYSHKNKLHKKLAVAIFVIAALGSILLGVKAIADGNSPSTNAASFNQSTVNISSSNAPIIQGNTITSTNQSGGFNGINNGGTVNLAPPDRNLTDEQIKNFTSKLKPFAGAQITVLRVLANDPDDVVRFSNQLCSVFKSANIGVVLNTDGVNSRSPLNIEIEVQDSENPPVLASTISDFLTPSFKAKITTHSELEDGQIVVCVAQRK